MSGSQTIKLLFFERSKEAGLSDIQNIIHACCSGRSIIGSLDFDFMKKYDNFRKISQIRWIALYKRFDMVAKDFLRRYPVGPIAKIVSGPDTFYNMPILISKRNFLIKTGIEYFRDISFPDR